MVPLHYELRLFGLGYPIRGICQATDQCNCHIPAGSWFLGEFLKGFIREGGHFLRALLDHFATQNEVPCMVKLKGLKGARVL